MIISIDAEKAFDKVQHPFKTLTKVSIEGIFLNIIKAIFDKPTANIILNEEEVKAFPLKSGTIQGLSTITTVIQHNIGSACHDNQTNKRNKNGIQIGREVVKL